MRTIMLVVLAASLGACAPHVKDRPAYFAMGMVTVEPRTANLVVNGVTVETVNETTPTFLKTKVPQPASGDYITGYGSSTEASVWAFDVTLRRQTPQVRCQIGRNTITSVAYVVDIPGQLGHMQCDYSGGDGSWAQNGGVLHRPVGGGVLRQNGRVLTQDGSVLTQTKEILH